MLTRAVLVLLFITVLFSSTAAQEATPPASSETSANVTIHVVQRGETLFRIAMHYRLTVAELAAYNGISDPNSIAVGQRLLIPAAGAANPVSLTAPPSAQTHTVQPGETLRSIAEFYGMTVEDLAAINGIVNPDAIYVGQTLNVVPMPQTAPPVVSTQSAPSQESAPAATAIVHVVQPGETLFRIATRYGVTVADVAAANGIADPTVIYAGQQLIIPGVQPPQIALDLPSPASAFDITPLVLVEGQTGRVRLTTSAPVTVNATFLGRAIPAASEQENTQHILFLPISIYTDPNVYPLQVNMTDAAGSTTSFSVNLQVLSGGYISERLTLPDTLVPLLEPSVEQYELSVMQSVMGTFSAQRYFDGPMSLPAAAAVTSPFGNRRSFNGSAFDHFHSGVDFAGASGTPVLAAAAGQVVLADTLNVRGVTTIIDHGWGIFTVYSHQTERYVGLGSYVVGGQQIGTIGTTGRTTGAHLHWEVWVNGVPVDGMQWVRQSFP